MDKKKKNTVVEEEGGLLLPGYAPPPPPSSHPASNLQRLTSDSTARFTAPPPSVVTYCDLHDSRAPGDPPTPTTTSICRLG